MTYDSRSWAVPSPASKYGGSFTTPSSPTRDDTPLAQVAGPAQAAKGADKLLHPGSPMLWLGVLVLGAFGLAGLSTSARVGPAKADIKVGNA